MEWNGMKWNGMDMHLFYIQKLKCVRNTVCFPVYVSKFVCCTFVIIALFGIWYSQSCRADNDDAIKQISSVSSFFFDGFYTPKYMRMRNFVSVLLVGVFPTMTDCVRSKLTFSHQFLLLSLSLFHAGLMGKTNPNSTFSHDRKINME